MTPTELPATWRAALENRREHFDLADPDQCLRLLHAEDESLRCDRFGKVCWFYRYPSSDSGQGGSPPYGALTSAAGARHWHVHDMYDRGGDPHARRHASSVDAPDAWCASENGLRFELRADSGQSPGLFLDQRDNRAWVRRHAEGARILNLFAYTGGFGIAALAGGARQVVQVDVSHVYLDWARANAALNGIDDERTEYSGVDARLFVDGCHRRGRRFEGVVCDPPSFGRGRRRSTRVFRVEDDLPELVHSCARLVDPGGWVLVSSNYEGWTQTRFEAAVAGAWATVEPAPGAGDDYRVADAEPLLKSCILRVS